LYSPSISYPDPYSLRPGNRAERIETARGAVSAKEPACRDGVLPDVTTGQGPGTPR